MSDPKFPSGGGQYRRKPNGDLERVTPPTTGQYRAPDAPAAAPPQAPIHTPRPGDDE